MQTKQNRLSFLRMFLFSALIFALIFGASSCIKRPSPAENEDKIEITFWTLQLSGFSDYINGVIKEYESLYPNVKIKWVDVPYSEGEKRALAAVMSNAVPDVINMNPAFGSTLASKGALLNLKNYIHEEKYNSYIPETWKASSIGEVVFGVPWYITSAVSVYNSDILEKCNIQDYDSIKTYEDLGKVASIIKEKTNKFAIMPNLSENGFMLKIFSKYDINLVDKIGRKASFNTPEAQRIMEFWKKMVKKGYVPKESLTETHRTSLEKYLSGETAFFIAGANFLKIIKENSPTIYRVSGVSTQLEGKNGKYDFSLMNLVVPKKSRHPEIAVDFALFLTNSKNQLEFCKLVPILPSSKESLESVYFKQIKSSDLMVKSRAISARQLYNALPPQNQLKNQKDLNEIIDLAVQKNILEEHPTKEALNWAELEWDKILSED